MPQRDPHSIPENAYAEVYTVIHDLGDGRDIAWITGAVWPPVGTVVELHQPERHALVVGIRLVLVSGERAIIRVDVQDPGEGELIARDAASRLVDVAPLEVTEAIGAPLEALPVAPPTGLADRA